MPALGQQHAFGGTQCCNFDAIAAGAFEEHHAQKQLPVWAECPQLARHVVRAQTPASDGQLHAGTQTKKATCRVNGATHYIACPDEASRLLWCRILQAQDERPLLGCDRLHGQAASGEQRHARQRAVSVRLELLQCDAPPQLAHLGQQRVLN